MGSTERDLCTLLLQPCMQVTAKVQALRSENKLITVTWTVHATMTHQGALMPVIMPVLTCCSVTTKHTQTLSFWCYNRMEYAQRTIRPAMKVHLHLRVDDPGTF
jgi:hypothetical protein